MIFIDGHAAYMQGFKDGYLNVWDTLIENYNHAYELGFITGAVESKNKRVEHKTEDE